LVQPSSDGDEAHVVTVESIISISATVASATASDASGAAGSDRTDVSWLIPKNITFGTKEACVHYDDHAHCHSLPLRLSDVLYDIPALTELESTISRVGSSRMEDCTILGSALASLVLLLLILYAAARVLRPREFTNQFMSWVYATVICSILSCVAFLIPVLGGDKFPSDVKNVHVPVQTDRVGNYCFGMFSGMGVSTFFLMSMGFINRQWLAAQTLGITTVGPMGRERQSHR